MTASNGASRVSVSEFEQIFESVKNWGRWGPADELGTLNYITPAKVREAEDEQTREGRLQMHMLTSAMYADNARRWMESAELCSVEETDALVTGLDANVV